MDKTDGSQGRSKRCTGTAETCIGPITLKQKVKRMYMVISCAMVAAFVDAMMHALLLMQSSIKYRRDTNSSIILIESPIRE